MKKLILLFAVFVALAWRAADKREHAEDVVLNMSCEEFDSIKEILGEDANIIQIAEYYERRKEDPERR